MTASLQFADIEVQPRERRLLRGGQAVPLGGRAFDIALARLFVAAIKKQRPDIDVFANHKPGHWHTKLSKQRVSTRYRALYQHIAQLRRWRA